MGFGLADLERRGGLHMQPRMRHCNRLSASGRRPRRSPPIHESREASQSTGDGDEGASMHLPAGRTSRAGALALAAPTVPGRARAGFGRWRPPNPESERGRGLHIMRALMKVEVRPESAGTEIWMRRQLRQAAFTGVCHAGGQTCESQVRGPADGDPRHVHHRGGRRAAVGGARAAGTLTSGHVPGTGAELEGTLRRAQPPSTFSPKCLSVRRLEGCAVCARGPDSGSKRNPEVVEVHVVGCDGQVACRHAGEAAASPEVGELSRPAEGHGLALIQGAGHLRVESHGCIPKGAQHPHALGVVPHARRHGCARTSDPPHLADAGLGIAHVVHHQLGQHHIELRIPEREVLRASLVNVHAPDAGSAGLDEGLGRIDRGYVLGPEEGGQGLGQGAGAASNVESTVAWVHPYSSEQELGKLSSVPPRASVIALDRAPSRIMS